MVDKISRIINVLKKYGLKKTFVKSIKYINANYLIKINFINIIKIKIKKRKYIEYLANIFNGEYDRIIVWRSNFGYNVPLYQRPQHIANNLSMQKCLVFYEVTLLTDYNVKDIQKIKDNLYLVNFNNKSYAKILHNFLKIVEEPKYIEFYSTDWYLSIKELKKYVRNGYNVIYEYVDDINAKISGTKNIPKNIMEKYNYAINNKNVYIVCTAKLLYENILKLRGKNNVILSSNGVDYKFYNQFNKYEIEKQYMNIIRNGKINICYYGALAYWFDYDLIKEISNTNKYNIILFGAKYDDSYNKNINKNNNIYYFGSKDYKILKYYTKEVDIFIIPFVVNDITKSTNPVKLFEYMALKKPIVTTNMDECKKYKSVLIGKNNKEFLSKLDEAYKLKKDKDYLELLDYEAKQNDWYYKANDILSLITTKK